jgi:hypothetical protein
MYGGNLMRTTLVLPDNLVNEAMNLTHITIKTDLIKAALEDIIQREKAKRLADYYGKVDLGIDIREIRAR